jgi:hypothetical protein
MSRFAMSKFVSRDDRERAILDALAKAEASTWRPMSEAPPRTGRYLVAHRGFCAVRHYLHPEGEWVTGSVVGWQGDLSWGPTYWAPIPGGFPE